MSSLEQVPIEYTTAPLENGADIGLRHSDLPPAESERALALTAVGMAIQSKAEVLKKPELTKDQRVIMLGEWIVKIRQADGTDTPATSIDVEALTRDMLELAA